MTMKTAVALGLGVFLMASTGAYAKVEPNDLCKAKKMGEAGKNALGLLKEFGKNGKKPDTGKLSAGISKAQSKITKGFTKAEWKGNGDPKGCDTTNDVGAIEAKVQAFVQDVIDELTPSPSGAFIDGMNGALY